jgi:hypothetical protein
VKEHLFLVPLAMSLALVSTGCGFPIMHKPAYEGRVIDAETRQPIEGVVVVAVYMRESMGIETARGIVDIREALTDRNGEFRFQPKLALVSPFTWNAPTRFCIFKRGYSNFPDDMNRQTKPGLSLREQELFFRGPVGQVRTIAVTNRTLAMGQVELQPLKSKEERRKVEAYTYHDARYDHRQPHMLQELEDERRFLSESEAHLLPPPKPRLETAMIPVPKAYGPTITLTGEGLNASRKRLEEHSRGEAKKTKAFIYKYRNASGQLTYTNMELSPQEMNDTGLTLIEAQNPHE